MSAIAEVWRNPYIRVLTYVLFAILIYITLHKVSSVVVVAILAYLFAYVFNPLVEWLMRRKLSRETSILIVFLIVLLFGMFAMFLISTIVTQLVAFGGKLPELISNLQVTLRDALARLEALRENPELRGIIDQITLAVQQGLSNLTKGLILLFQGTAPGLVTTTFGILGNILQFFLVFIIGGYMLSSFQQIGKTVIEIFPRRWQPLVLDFSKDVTVAVGGYIRGQMIIAVAVGTMVGLGLAILGIPLALTLGFISAIFNIVPYLGVVISITPALLLALQFGPIKVVLVMVVFLVANQIEAQILSPLVLSKATNLHPVTVVLSILTGVALVGIWGGLLAVPLAALVNLLIRKYWLRSRYYGAA